MKLFKFLFLCIILQIVWSSSARAWDPNELPPGFTVEKEAPVELEGKTLFGARSMPKPKQQRRGQKN
jgi:hypothetical protein